MDLASSVALQAWGFMSLYAVDTFICVLPLVGYTVQVLEIKASRSAEGLALPVSFILLACNTLRVLYFFGFPFAKALLVQSVLMITLQLYLVVTALDLRSAARLACPPEEPPTLVSPAPVRPPKSRMPTPTRATPRPEEPPVKLPGPTESQKFLTAYVGFVVAAVLLCAALFTSLPPTLAARIVGFSALGIESTMLLPQVWLNRSRRSTAGLSKVLVTGWFIGDVSKLTYFLLLEQPVPFIICAATQLLLDCVVVGQMAVYDPLDCCGCLPSCCLCCSRAPSVKCDSQRV